MRGSHLTILKGGCLESQDGSPAAADEPVTVRVVAEARDVSQVGVHMAAALGELAASGAFSGLVDAAEWERVVREERGLPGGAASDKPAD